MIRLRRFDPGVVVVCLALFVTVGAGAIFATGPSSASVTRLDSCTTIDEPGVYVLTTDLTDVESVRLSESCIDVRSDDVVFDGRGHRIDGRGISDTRGVTVNESTGASNVTVRDVKLTDWNVGVYYRNVTGGELRNVTATENGFGIRYENTTGVPIRDSEISRNLVGLSLATDGDSLEGSGNTFAGNYVANRSEADTGERDEGRRTPDRSLSAPRSRTATPGDTPS